MMPLSWFPRLVAAVALGCFVPAAVAAKGGELAGTHLAAVAATVKPGTFVPIETRLPEGMKRLPELFRVRVDDGRQLSIDGWTDSAHWDPERLRTFFIGMRKYKKFISYDPRENRWSELGWEGEPPPKMEKFGHVYGRTALDWKRGHYYWLSPGKRLNRYVIDARRWEAFDGVPISGYISMEWHEKIDRLVALNYDYQFVTFRDGETQVLGKGSVHGYHSVGRYNRKRGDMLFAGGNKSRDKVTVIDSQGAIHIHKDAPFTISIGRSSLTYDPVSGNYLVMSGRERKLYEYQPDRQEWRVAGDWSAGGWPFGEFGFYTPIVIDELGVIFWQAETGNQVYRHKSVFGKGE